MNPDIYRELDGWAYCIEHDECVDYGDSYQDDIGDPACRAWLHPDDDEQACRFVALFVERKP